MGVGAFSTKRKYSNLVNHNNNVVKLEPQKSAIVVKLTSRTVKVVCTKCGVFGPQMEALDPDVRRISTAAASRYAQPQRPVSVVPVVAPLPLPARGSPPQRGHTRPPPPPPLSASPSTRRPPPQPPITQQPMSAVPPAPPPQPQSPLREVIRLDSTRTTPRRQNDYVDNPHQFVTHKTPSQRASERRNLRIGHHGHPVGQAITSRASPTSGGPSESTDPTPIFTQPQKDKDPPATAGLTQEEEHRDSIICSKCGKCKCQECTQPRDCCRPVWLCNNQCECSLQKGVEYASCLCCVRALFYHCYKDKDGQSDRSATDDPCACCEQPDCCKRWASLGLLSLCLPCLCFYWPLQCCLSSGTACYNRCSRRGCHCRRDKPHNITKRLLIESESSST